jgi:hypothetical protein
VRLNAIVQTVVPVLFGLGLIVLGIIAFVRVGSSQQQLETKLQRIQAGEIQPNTLTVVRKYVDAGRSGLPHVVFSSDRQPKVNLAVTVDFFNSVKVGDTVAGYGFPDGYFIPRNQKVTGGLAKWFLLGLGVLLGVGVLALAFASARSKSRVST